MNVRDQDQLLRMASEIFDGTISAPDAADLASRLTKDIEATALYIEFLTLDVTLAWAYGQYGGCGQQAALLTDRAGTAQQTTEMNNPMNSSPSVGCAPGSLPPSPILSFLARSIVAPLLSRGAVFWLVAIVTNAVLVCTLALVLSPDLRVRLTGKPDHPVATQAIRSSAPLPARLVSALDCHWDSAAKQPVVGQKLEAGPLHLLAGVVQLEFADGARVSFVGPSEFEIRDASHVHLEMGELRAFVPQQAIGFRVLTPSAEVVDLGTEFGVRVKGLETFVHCFRGKVRMHPSANAKSPQTASRQLVAGHSGSIDGDGWVESEATESSPAGAPPKAEPAADSALAQADKPEAPGEDVAASQLINVQIAPPDQPAYEGSGVVKSDKRAKWSVASPAPVKPATLHTIDGAATGVVCNIEDATTCTTIFNSCGDALHDTYCFVGEDSPGHLTISGLAPQQNYDLFLFGTSGVAAGEADAAGEGAPEGSLFTVDDQTKSTVGLRKGDNLLTEGKDYVVFRAVRPDATGTVRVSWIANKQSNPPLNNNRFGPFNGLQIVGPTMSN